jgi:transposase
MPRRIQVAPHPSVDELEQRYRQAKDAIESHHYQIIWLLAQGKRTEEVAELTGYSRSWIYELVWGYNRVGAESLGDKRRHNRGATRLLDDYQQAQLWQLLQEQPSDGDLWDGAKVAERMSQLLGRKVHPQRGWEYLRAMEMRLRRPRREHQESDPVEQEVWKKTGADRRAGAAAVPGGNRGGVGRR